MEEGTQSPMDMRLLPALVTELAFQLRPAIEASALMRAPVGSAGTRLDGTANQRSGRNVPDDLDIRHSTTPLADIMRCRGRVLAVSA